MTKETMTVHKGLGELSILADRIFNTIRESKFVTSKKHCETQIGGRSVEEFNNASKSALSKVKDLIERRNAIKRAIVQSNAVTKVTVGDKSYTVAEAIDAKANNVRFITQLRDELLRQNNNATRACDNMNERLDEKGDEFVRATYGNTDLKGLSEEVNNRRKDFIKDQTSEVVDPVGAPKVVEALTADIDKFNSEVDSVLAASNATTVIKVEY